MLPIICECTADITVERKFEPREPTIPWLWITFTVGTFPLLWRDITFELCPGMAVSHGTPTDGGSALTDVDALLKSIDDIGPAFPQDLNATGNSLIEQFERTGRKADIDRAILACDQAVKATPAEHPRHAVYVGDCGRALLGRFRLSENLDDAHQAICMLEQSVSFAAENDIDLPRRLGILGDAFDSRFGRTGDLADLENAISNLQRAVELTPHGHAHLALHLNTLGNAFESRFGRTGDLSDLEIAISNIQRAIELTPHGHARMPPRLNNLGNAFESRFHRTGDLADLENAISNLQRAVELTPHGHIHMPLILNNLGGTFQSRFRRTGDLADVGNAISNLRCAIELTPHGHARLPRSLNNLGNAFKSRFRRTGDLADIENAISNLQRAVELTPCGHADMPSRLNNLGNAFRSRFGHTGDLADLENAIYNLRHAVKLTPLGHADMASWLNNLGCTFQSRFDHTGDLTDLENAISNLQRAVELTPHGHAHMASRLNSLGTTFKSRFDRTGDLADLENAISNLQHTIELTPNDHADMAPQLSNLGDAFESRFQYTRKPGDIDQAISAYCSSATHITGAPALRLRAAQTWAQLSPLSANADTLVAFGTAIELLAQVAGLEQTVSKRYKNLGDAPDLTTSASAAAIDAGQSKTAIEWLEQGRCLVWNQIQQLRTPVEDLRVHNPPLADRFIHIANELETFGSRQTNSVIFSGTDMSQMIAAQDENKRHVELAKEWTELLDDIHALPSFSNFLRPPTSSDLFADLPLGGTVVIFNVHKNRCDALALTSGTDAPLHIPLPDFSYKRAVELRDSLGAYLKRQGVRMREGERAGRPFKQPKEDTQESVVHMVLREIWENVVKPILDALAYNNSVSCLLTLVHLRLMDKICSSLGMHPDRDFGGVPLAPLPSSRSMPPGSTLQMEAALDLVCRTLSFPRIHRRLAP